MASCEGLIVSALGGFYYVLDDTGEVRECRARGSFRRDGVSPFVGDRVIMLETEAGHGSVEKILPRKNLLTRPPVANVKRLVLVVSIVEPPPNILVLDKLIAIAEHKGIEPVLVITKTDLDSLSQSEGLWRLYKSAGFSAFCLSSETGQGVEELLSALSNGINCFCGNTGVGKSSLLNAIDPKLLIETGEISKKLGRGRHTTRHAELYHLKNGGYIADTPGFSAVELSRYETIFKGALQGCFREFAPYLERCRFSGCSHTCEAGCAVLEAVQNGKIAQSRHESYLSMYEDAKRIKEWETTK